MFSATHASASPILDALRRGRASSKMEVYRKLCAGVYPTALRIARVPEDAEDAMQEAFLRLFRYAPDLDSDDSLLAWLRRTAANCAIDILRRRSLFSPAAADDASDIPDPSDEELLDNEALAHDIDEIHAAMMELPDAYRTILSLSLFEGYDNSEIEEITGLSQGAIRVKYLRAKQRLVLQLKNKNFTPYYG